MIDEKRCDDERRSDWCNGFGEEGLMRGKMGKRDGREMIKWLIG